MNKPEKLTFKERIRDAVNAFHGRKIGSLHFGVDLKRCDQCEYRRNDLRDCLLVTAGSRAGYMDTKGYINIPVGVDAEADLAYFITKTVDRYLIQDTVNFDTYVESALMQKYGGSNE